MQLTPKQRWFAIEHQAYARHAHIVMSKHLGEGNIAHAIEWQEIAARHARLARGYIGLNEQDICNGEPT